MRKVVTNEKLQAEIRLAKRLPGMRIGQHVFNTFLAGTALETPHASRLFYCADSDFWKIVHEFIVIEEPG